MTSRGIPGEGRKCSRFAAGSPDQDVHGEQGRPAGPFSQRDKGQVQQNHQRGALSHQLRADRINQ